MPSSTSPSKSSPGRLTWRLLAVAAVGWLGCAGYSLCLEPGQRFYLEAARIKRAWAEKMGREHKSRILVYGGSSCAFSINGERILGEQGLPVVNMGLGAGYGARFLTRWALSEARPGDSLIVALEPGLLNGDLTDTSRGGPSQLRAASAGFAAQPRQFTYDLAGLANADAAARLQPRGDAGGQDRRRQAALSLSDRGHQP